MGWGWKREDGGGRGWRGCVWDGVVIVVEAGSSQLIMALVWCARIQIVHIYKTLLEAEERRPLLLCRSFVVSFKICLVSLTLPQRQCFSSA